jgi:hypothetical protein
MMNPYANSLASSYVFGLTFDPFQSSGYLLNPLILKTFAIHFETTWINADSIACKYKPIGALTLTLAAVSHLQLLLALFLTCV